MLSTRDSSGWSIEGIDMPSPAHPTASPTAHAHSMRAALQGSARAWPTRAWNGPGLGRGVLRTPGPICRAAQAQSVVRPLTPSGMTSAACHHSAPTASPTCASITRSCGRRARRPRQRSTIRGQGPDHPRRAGQRAYANTNSTIRGQSPDEALCAAHNSRLSLNFSGERPSASGPEAAPL